MSDKFPSPRSLWLASFLGRLTFLLFHLSVLTLYFYLVGNFQELTERTLLLLVNMELWILAICAAAAFFSSLSYAIVNIWGDWKKKTQFFFSLLALALSIAMYLIVSIIHAFFSPYLPGV